MTGASRGIGAAVAQALAPTHDLLLGGRDADALGAVARDLEADGRTIRPWPVDLTDEAALAEAVEQTDGLVDHLDVLVHSAGVGMLGTVAELDAATWRTQFDVNVVAVAELTRLLLPGLRAAHGTVVLINSGAGLAARPGWGSYAASKFALRAFGDALRGEEPDLRVTSVHPGRVDTDMQRAVVAHEGGTYRASSYLRPDSVAAAVLTAVSATADAHITDVVVRPTG